MRMAMPVCQSRRKKGPFAGVKVGQLRCRALLGVLPIKLTRDKAHVGQRPPRQSDYSTVSVVQYCSGIHRAPETIPSDPLFCVY